MAFPAALMSAIVPGFGHFLIRAWTRGAIWLAGWLILGSISGAHSPVMLVLVAVTAVDAYVIARSHRNPTSPAVVGGSREHKRG